MILSYSLISSALLLCGYTVYCLFMAGQRQFGCNRAALLSVYFAALLLPGVIMLMPSGAAHGGDIAIGALQGGAMAGAGQEAAARQADTARLALAIYLAGAMAMAANTAWSYISLWRIARSRSGIECRGCNIIIVDGLNVAPFCWCKTMVMSRSDYESHGRMILEHELEHMRRGHWADLLLAQAVLCLQWYNPAAWSMRARLRSVHDYQADAAVIAAGCDPAEYQLLLIKKNCWRTIPPACQQPYSQ